jgi:hypothetical protein
MAQIYSGVTPAVALAAATAKTCAAITGGAGDSVTLIEMAVSFDGVTASAVPVTVELCDFTVATSGTRTTGSPTQTRGQRVAVTSAFFHTYTVEPTVLTVLYRWYISPNGGLFHLQFPLGREPDLVVAKGMAIRCTAPATVNTTVTMVWEE